MTGRASCVASRDPRVRACAGVSARARACANRDWGAATFGGVYNSRPILYRFGLFFPPNFVYVRNPFTTLGVFRCVFQECN